MPQSKQTHTPTTPAHLNDDPCDNWISLGTATQRVIDDYAPDEDPDEDIRYARTFTRFMGVRR